MHEMSVPAACSAGASCPTHVLYFLTTHGRQDGKQAQRETAKPVSLPLSLHALYAVTAITRHPEGYLLH